MVSDAKINQNEVTADYKLLTKLFFRLLPYSSYAFSKNATGSSCSAQRISKQSKELSSLILHLADIIHDEKHWSIFIVAKP